MGLEREAEVSRRLPLEAELVPFVASFPPGKGWLVLAPHPDDEVLGPGATLALAAQRGVSIATVILTDGAAQGEAAVRAGEARRAAAALGVQEPQQWGLADRSLHPQDRQLVGRLIELLLASHAETVLLPSPVELHPDHRATALAVQRAVRRLTWGGVRRRGPRWVACYEVSAPLLPNLLVAADGGWQAKRAGAACYASQLAVRPYLEVAEGLGAFRALTLAGCSRAEGFHVLSSRVLARLTARGWAARMGSPRCVATRPGQVT